MSIIWLRPTEFSYQNRISVPDISQRLTDNTNLARSATGNLHQPQSICKSISSSVPDSKIQYMGSKNLLREHYDEAANLIFDGDRHQQSKLALAIQTAGAKNDGTFKLLQIYAAKKLQCKFEKDHNQLLARIKMQREYIKEARKDRDEKEIKALRKENDKYQQELIQIKREYGHLKLGLRKMQDEVLTQMRGSYETGGQRNYHPDSFLLEELVQESKSIDTLVVQFLAILGDTIECWNWPNLAASPLHVSLTYFSNTYFSKYNKSMLLMASDIHFARFRNPNRKNSIRPKTIQNPSAVKFDKVRSESILSMTSVKNKEKDKQSKATTTVQELGQNIQVKIDDMDLVVEISGRYVENPHRLELDRNDTLSNNGKLSPVLDLPSVEGRESNFKSERLNTSEIADKSAKADKIDVKRLKSWQQGLGQEGRWRIPEFELMDNDKMLEDAVASIKTENIPDDTVGKIISYDGKEEPPPALLTIFNSPESETSCSTNLARSITHGTPMEESLESFSERLSQSSPMPSELAEHAAVDSLKFSPTVDVEIKRPPKSISLPNQRVTLRKTNSASMTRSLSSLCSGFRTPSDERSDPESCSTDFNKQSFIEWWQLGSASDSDITSFASSQSHQEVLGEVEEDLNPAEFSKLVEMVRNSKQASREIDAETRRAAKEYWIWSPEYKDYYNVDSDVAIAWYFQPDRQQRPSDLQVTDAPS